MNQHHGSTRSHTSHATLCPCVPAICMHVHVHAHVYKPLMTRHHAMSPPQLHACHLPQVSPPYPPFALVVPPPLHICSSFSFFGHMSNLQWENLWHATLFLWKNLWFLGKNDGPTTWASPPRLLLYIGLIHSHNQYSLCTPTCYKYKNHTTPPPKICNLVPPGHCLL
jgi:hypothetical protein